MHPVRLYVSGKREPADRTNLDDNNSYLPVASLSVIPAPGPSGGSRELEICGCQESESRTSTNYVEEMGLFGKEPVCGRSKTPR